MTVGAVFRSIRIISEVAACLPMRTYSRDSAGDLTPLKDSHWLNSLVEEPNEVMGGVDWREAMFAQMAGWGNCYSQIVTNDADPNQRHAVELWPYKVDRMQASRQDDLTLAYKYPDVNGAYQVLPTPRVWHCKAFTLDGYMGASPLRMARETMGLAVGAADFAAGYFAAGGRPAAVMTSDKILTQAQRDQIRLQYSSMADNEENRRFWVLEAGLKYQAVTANPEDLQMLETRAFQIEDIARFFGVPLFLLMASEKSTSWGTGMEQQNLSFLTYTLMPYLSKMTQTYNRRIIPPAERGKVCVEIDPTPLQVMDSAALQAFLNAGAQNGMFTRNEARRKYLKLPRSNEKNADVLTVQTALTPLSKLGETPPAAKPFPSPANAGAQS